MDKVIYIIFLILNLFSTLIKSDSFIYPVAYDELNNLIYIIHQKSIYELNLWVWNPEQKVVQKALLSNYLPGAIKLIPNCQSFSFIDKSRLRIKCLQKRSPKTIDFSEPICDMNMIHWIDAQNFYFCARKNRNFIICTSNVKDPEINVLIEKEHDCIYPQLLKDKLFYIERYQTDNVCNGSKNNYKIIEQQLSTKKESIILIEENKSIAFLSMISENEGFYLEHPSSINRKNKMITFNYYQIKKDNDIWVNSKLFSFLLPSSYIFGPNDQRLYESILPFLPKHYKNKIYYPHQTESEMNIYSYDLISKQTQLKTKNQPYKICLCPILVNNRFYYGYCANDLDFDELNFDNLLPFYEL